jgi:2-phosphosulfolactate phosphatase
MHGDVSGSARVPDTCRVLMQRDVPVHFDWGPTAAKALGEGDGCLVIIDILSFTTAVSVAVSRGMEVLPYRFGDRGLTAFAAARGARFAVKRHEVTSERPWSLSPVALSGAPVTRRLVLPSPNGSAIASEAAGPAVAACLRNCTAVVRWLLEQRFGTEERPIAVIAAGERWPDGSLRPALEDALGAGAVLAQLQSVGCELSSEARAMAALYNATDQIAEAIRSSVSGRELILTGYGGDVTVALEADSETVVPVLLNGAFVAQ